MVTDFTVIWNDNAKKQLRKAYRYIRKDSPQNAEQVKTDILTKAASLKDQPLRYGADKLRHDGDPKFRAFELHHYRISYFIDEAAAQVIILRIRHTSQAPLEY